MGATWIFRPEKLHQKNACKTYGFFDLRDYTEKNPWKHCGFFDHRNYIEKSMRIKRGWSKTSEIMSWMLCYIMSSTWKLHGFFNHQITSKKVRGKGVDFSISEITSKKYMEITCKFVEIWPSTYRRNINVESRWMRRGVPVG